MTHTTDTCTTLPTVAEPIASSRLLTVDDVAGILRCSSRHVYRLADSGRMPQPIRIGSLVRWQPSVIESWIAQGCPSTRSKGGKR